MKGYKTLLKLIGYVVFIGTLSYQGAVQALTLDDIKFAALPGDEFEVKLQFSEVPPEPNAYVIENPARIVFDFAGAESALDEKKYALAFENARSAVVVSAGGRTRVILNLNHTAAYNSSIEGNAVSIRVGGGGSVATVDTGSQYSDAETQRFTDSSGSRSVTNVDFNRGLDGEGNVVLTLSDPKVNVDVSHVGNEIVLKFYRTSLAEGLDRRLDVNDFATPIKTVDTTYDGSTTEIRIEAAGEYDYLAYQADEQYVVSVKELTEDEVEERKSKFEFVGEKLSLNFQDIEVRSVLQLIADFTDLNLVASDTVRGSITLRLENVPWDQALDIILKAKGLDKRQEGNVLMVAPAAEIAEQERLLVAANKQLEELAPLRTEFIRIRYADADELFKVFLGRRDGGASSTAGAGTGGRSRTSTGSILSSRGSAIVDKRTNTIVLTDTEEKIAQFRRLVEEIDIPVRQVEIEARIVIANTDFRKELGFRWGIAGLRQPGDDIFEFGGSRDVLDSSPGAPLDFFGGGGTLDLSETLAVDLGVAGPSGSIAFDLITDNTLIDLELSALENSGQGEVVSQPKVLTGDKQKATIEAGTQIPFLKDSSSGATSVQFEDAVLKLEVTPQITPDNRVIMDLVIQQDSIGQFVPSGRGGNVPTIDVTQVETQALVGDGQTLVLGGIFQMEEVSNEEKVPLLGDIPYMGRLFKNTVRDSTKREILIFITPKIISDPLLNK